MNESTHLTLPSAIPGRNERTSLSETGRDSVSSAISTAYGYDHGDEQAAHLRDYWLIIRKRLWLIVGITILLPTLVAIYVVRQPDIYESQARVQVDLESANPLLGGMSKNSSIVLNNEKNDPAYFNTQLQILTGPGLLRRIVKNLDLEHNPEFLSSHSSNSKSMWGNLRRMLGFKSQADSRQGDYDLLPIAPSDSSNKTVVDLKDAERLSDYVDELQQTLVSRVDDGTSRSLPPPSASASAAPG